MVEMTILSNIAAAFRALGREVRTGGVTYIFDRKKGFVELRTDPRLVIRLELFKKFMKSGNWGCELTIRNKSGETIDELLIVFNKKYSILLNKMKPDSMKIKSLEFQPNEFETDGFVADVSAVMVQAKKPVSGAYTLTVPMQSILSELSELGKVTQIEEKAQDKPAEVDTGILQGFEAEFIKRSSIKPRVAMEEGKPVESREALERKLEELESQKGEITKSFMKREIDYTTFSQLMNPIVQETILIKSQLSKLE